MSLFDLPPIDLGLLFLGGSLALLAYIRGLRRGYRAGWSDGAADRATNGPCRLCGGCAPEGAD